MLYERRYRAITRRYFAMTGTLLSVVEHKALHRPLIKLAHALPSAFTTILGKLSHIDAHAERPQEGRATRARSSGRVIAV